MTIVAKIKFHLLLITAAFAFSILSGCSDARVEDNTYLPQIDETAILIDYLQQNGNVVNHTDIPYTVTPEEVYQHLSGYNQLLVDLRSTDEFIGGHIDRAVNIHPENILHYLENIVNPAAFEKIIMICNNAMLSGYVTATLRMVGYDNVYALRNGLSSWDMGIAERYWLAAMSSHMEGNLETTFHKKNEPGLLPVIHTGKQQGYDILRERAQSILSANPESTLIAASQILDDPSGYYIINYWPMDLYEQGHIAGAIHYEPKASLGKDQYLNTLPKDRPIVLYCFTGHHSAYPVAYLRLLGYDAYHIPYGVNAFMQQTMLDTQPPNRSFSVDMVRNFPLRGANNDHNNQTIIPETETKTIIVEGGC